MKTYKTTNYGLITGFYFRKILKTVIKLGKFKIVDKTVLDFGCGSGELKKLVFNGKSKIINYDIKPKYSEINNWEDVAFDTLVANQVFYTFTQTELEELLQKLGKHNPNLELIVSISKQGLINKLGALLFFEFDAHRDTKLKINKEKEIINKFAEKIISKNVLFLSEVIVYKFIYQVPDK